MKIYSKPCSVLICNNYNCYKLYRIYSYNFTQVRSSYAWKSHKYCIHHSNIIILGTQESEKKIRGELRLEFFRGKIPSSEASSFPARRGKARSDRGRRETLCSTRPRDRCLPPTRAMGAARAPVLSSRSGHGRRGTHPLGRHTA